MKFLICFDRIRFEDKVEKGLTRHLFMRKLLLSLITSALISASGLAVNAQEWIKFAPEGGRFEVNMPAEPRASATTTQSAHGPYTTTTFVLRTADTTYLIGYVDYDPAFNFNVKNEIAANRDNFLKGLDQSKLLAEKEITFEGNPGLEFTADLPNGRYATSRIFVVGRRPYQLVAVIAKGADQTTALRFLDSFRLKQK